MSNLVGNPEVRFPGVAAQMEYLEYRPTLTRVVSFKNGNFQRHQLMDFIFLLSTKKKLDF